MSKWTLSTRIHETLPPRDSAVDPDTSDDGIVVSRSRSHEFTATEIDREQWTAAFWALFPTDEEAFVELVQTTGIVASVTLDFEPEAVVQAEYGGVAAHKLSRLLLSDTVSAHLDRLYGPRATVDEVSLARFRRDLDAWQSEYGVAAERGGRRLPHPPNGFNWIANSGGATLTREVGGWSAPEQLTYRLWRRDLGYMPTSE